MPWDNNAFCCAAIYDKSASGAYPSCADSYFLSSNLMPSEALDALAVKAWGQSECGLVDWRGTVLAATGI